MVYQFNEVKIGTPIIPNEWDRKANKFVEIDYKDYFIRSSFKKDPCNYVSDTIQADSRHYHTNYMVYLEKCWADHLGIVISPDVVWYTLLSEFSSLVKKDPDHYRHLFTISDKKEEISIPSPSLTKIPLNILTAALKTKIPSDISIFPIFNTFIPNNDIAFMACFCDICSPFYNYCMYLCGFPVVDVKGTIEDWKALKDQWLNLIPYIHNKDIWVRGVSSILNSILVQFKSNIWWKDIFKLKKCGSGHQSEVVGWFSDLFIDQPRVRFSYNFSTHISVVSYTQLDTQKRYEMNVGLFSSALNEGIMVPSFSSIIFNKESEDNNAQM